MGTFTQPESSKDAITVLQDLVSPVAAFVWDRCDRGAQHEVSCEALFNAWKSWAEDNGHRPGNAQTLGRNLRAVVPGLKVRQRRDPARTSRHDFGSGKASSFGIPSDYSLQWQTTL